MLSWILLGLFLAVCLLAPWLGIDSRDGRDWQPRDRHRG